MDDETRPDRVMTWLVRVTVPEGDNVPDESWYRMQARWFLSQASVFADAVIKITRASDDGATFD